MDDIIDDLVIGDIDITLHNNPTLVDGVNGKGVVVQRSRSVGGSGNSCVSYQFSPGHY